MSDERKRSNQWAGLLDAWPAPTPNAGFADRVLAACDLPPVVQLAIVREPPARRLTASGLLVCAAIAAALVLIPFAFHRRQPPVSAANAMTLGHSFDLGPERD
jgi:hypothetical protein